jgi:hypothetical protein
MQIINKEKYNYLTNLYLNDDLREVALLKNKHKDIDFQFFITQLGLLKKSENKFPTFFKNRCFFTEKSYQQATSEFLAVWKSNQFSGKILFDLTGGLGIDDWAYSKHFEHIYSFDTDFELNKLVRENCTILNIENITRFDKSAEEVIDSIEYCDVIYIDPDRRPISDSRVHSLYHMQPDIFNIISAVEGKYDKIIIKLSPLFDVKEVFKQIPLVSEVWCLAVKNEMKEVLAIIDSKSNTKQILAADLSANYEHIYSSDNVEVNSIQAYNKNEKYFYEPNHALIHSGLWKKYFQDLNGKVVNDQIPYMVLEEKLNDFYGRKFMIVSILDFKPKELMNYFKTNGISKANISRRNFKLNPFEIYNKLKLKEGGDDYLFFVEDHHKVLKCFHCKKLA